jgi:hypothetical protein
MMDTLGTLKNKLDFMLRYVQKRQNIDYAKSWIRVRGLEFDIGSEYLPRQGFWSIRSTMLIYQYPVKNKNSKY